MTSLLVAAAAALLPVAVFLLVLVLMDGYQLVRTRSVLGALLAGAVAASAARVLNAAVVGAFDLDASWFSLYGAPVLEEALKAVWLVGLIARGRVGFLADAAILGFGVGAGFAIVENLYFLEALPHAQLAVWVIRGFGTAAMHGATAALLGIVLQGRAECAGRLRRRDVMAAAGLAMLVHSVYNHFFLSPALTVVAIVAGLPFVTVYGFRRSDRSVSRWLGLGFDTDAELLALIDSGRVGESPVGEYLETLGRRFPPEVVADMFCLLRITVELSIEAKGRMLMRRAGYDTPPSDEAAGKLAELAWLEKSIGATGRLALHPLMPRERRDLWQLHLLQ